MFIEKKTLLYYVRRAGIIRKSETITTYNRSIYTFSSIFHFDAWMLRHTYLNSDNRKMHLTSESSQRYKLSHLFITKKIDIFYKNGLEWLLSIFMITLESCHIISMVTIWNHIDRFISAKGLTSKPVIDMQIQTQTASLALYLAFTHFWYIHSMLLMFFGGKNF